MSYFFEEDSEYINQPLIGSKDMVVSTMEDDQHELSIFFAGPDAKEQNIFDHVEKEFIDVQSSQFELEPLSEYENGDIFERLINQNCCQQEPRSFEQKKKTVRKAKSKKNSNLIKKMGRMIMENLRFFKRKTHNKGLERMLEAVKGRAEQGKGSLKDPKDGFNTSHLTALFSDEASSSFNLSTSRKLFTSKLREEVFSSCQIRMENKVLYLNSLKSSSLRFMNSRLASRLQISDTPHH